MLRTRSVAVGLVLFAAAPALAKDPAKPHAKPAAPGPSAAQVVVRRSDSLTRAVRAAYDHDADLGPQSGVFLVFDVTPAAKAEVLEAVGALGDVKRPPGGWSATDLGGSFGSPVAGLADLTLALGDVLARHTHPSRDGVGLLRKTLKSAAGKPGLVLLFAHGHLEDDANLEALIADLHATHRMLCVIGPEAAYESAWGEMFSVGTIDAKSGDLEWSVEGVGRSPFGDPDPKAPWRGGDTAYPMLPYEFGTSADWDLRASRRLTQFGERFVETPDPRVDPDGFDEWARRRVTPPDREKAPGPYRAWLAKVGAPPDRFRESEAYQKWLRRFQESAPAAPSGSDPAGCTTGFTLDQLIGTSWAEVPVPSSFGPYGWMRAAGATGGAYVLWGWSKGKSLPYKYDYSKCNGLPPDLRARGEVLADALRRPLAVALTAAWTALAQGPDECVDRTPPIAKGAPASIEHLYGVLFDPIFRTPEERDRGVAEAQRDARVLDGVRTVFAAAVEKAGEPKDDVDRRLRADADLFLHGLETVRFHVGEWAACASRIPPSGWKMERGRFPSITRVDWVCAHPDDVPPAPPWLKAFDPVAGDRVAAARKAFLERYKGTPVASIVARNPISTYRADVWQDPKITGTAYPTGGSGSSRGGGTTTPPPPPSDGSTGQPGPTTGR